MSLPIFKTELENSNIKSDKCPKSSDVEYVNGIPVYDMPNNADEKLNKLNVQPTGCYIIDTGSTEKDDAKDNYERECASKYRTGIYYNTKDSNGNDLYHGICHMKNISSLQKSPVQKFIMFLIMSLVFVISISIVACCGEFWLKFGHGKICIKVINTCLNIGKDNNDNTASLTEQHFRYRISNYPYQKCIKTSTNIDGGALNSHNKAKTEIDHYEIESENCIYKDQGDANINEKPFPYNIGEYAENNFDGELSKLLPRMITLAITCFMMSFRYIFNILNKKGCDMYEKVSKNKYMGLLLFIFIPVILSFISGFMTIIPFIGAIVFILFFVLSILEIILLHYGFFFNQNGNFNIPGGFFIIAGIILSLYIPLYYLIDKHVVKTKFNRYNNELDRLYNEQSNTNTGAKEGLSNTDEDISASEAEVGAEAETEQQSEKSREIDDYMHKLNELAKYIKNNYRKMYYTLNLKYVDDTDIPVNDDNKMSVHSDKFFMAGGILAILIGGTLHQIFGKNKPKTSESETNESEINVSETSESETKEKIDPDQKIANAFRKPLALLLRIFEFDKLTDKQKEQYYNYRPEKLSFTKDSYKINGMTIINIIFAIILLITFTSSSDSLNPLWIIVGWIVVFGVIIILTLLKGHNPENFPLWTSIFFWVGLSKKYPERNTDRKKLIWTGFTTYLKDPTYDIGYIGYVFKKILYMMTHLLLLFITLIFVNPVFGICYLFSIFDILFKFFLKPIFDAPRLFFELLKKRSLFLTLFFCVLVITSIQKAHLFGEQTDTTVGIMAAVFAMIVLYNIYISNKE